MRWESISVYLMHGDGITVPTHNLTSWRGLTHRTTRKPFPLKPFPKVTLAVGKLVRRNHYELTLRAHAQTA